MNEQPLTAQDIEREISDITEMAKRERVELTSEVQEYLHDGMERVLEKNEKGGVTRDDLEFLNDVKIWMQMPEDLRKYNPDISKMLEAENEKFEFRKCLTMQQCKDLLHLAEAMGEDIKWLSETFEFAEGNTILIPQKKIIEEDEDGNIKETFNPHVSFEDAPIERLPEGLVAYLGVNLWICNTLMESLPENLDVSTGLIIEGRSFKKIPNSLNCTGTLKLRDTSITELPDRLEVGGLLEISETDINSLPYGLKCRDLRILDYELIGKLYDQIMELKERGNIVNLGDAIQSYQPNMND